MLDNDNGRRSSSIVVDYQHSSDHRIDLDNERPTDFGNAAPAPPRTAVAQCPRKSQPNAIAGLDRHSGQRMDSAD